MAGYGHPDRARWVDEGAKRPSRSAFARDRARVLHSAGWRRLSSRTQVVAAGQDDFPRTRMTHSLECAQVGRELGESLGCDPDLVEMACLAHDLGHPPFGHNGETALNEVAADIGGFEGNAQTLRVLTRLEPKVFGTPPGQAEQRSVGLNLTRASLDAACKYPWLRGEALGTGKFGVYADDLAAFDWFRADAPERSRCFEAQVMDWSDDVAYCVHDVEDGIQAGHIDVRALASAETARLVCEVAASSYRPDRDPAALLAAYDRLSGMWPVEFSGSQRDLAAVKNLTSTLIGRFTRAAERATRAAFPGKHLRRYGAELIIPEAERDEVAVLKAIANHFVMSRRGALEVQAREREQLIELVQAILARGAEALSPEFRDSWRAAQDQTQHLRVAVDQVASLTDHSARGWHAKLVGSR